MDAFLSCEETPSTASNLEIVTFAEGAESCLVSNKRAVIGYRYPLSRLVIYRGYPTTSSCPMPEEVDEEPVHNGTIANHQDELRDMAGSGTYDVTMSVGGAATPVSEYEEVLEKL